MDLLKSLKHPEEICALIRYKTSGCSLTTSREDSVMARSPELSRCYFFLNKTSRSFAAVIQALKGDLRDAVCIFYLVLRALDTVEDDMTIPLEEKTVMLKKFHTYLLDEEWNYTGSNEKHRMVLDEFPVISKEFRTLKLLYREVILDICQRMGEGMTVYLATFPKTMSDWDEYCHYAAGLVGIGLSRLFSVSGLEDKILATDVALSNSMGLFLQKTNIIRDYLEDVLLNRLFWPQDAWGKYVKEMKEFTEMHHRPDAVLCLNELIISALSHIPDVMKYLSRIRNQSIYNFCAIPQVMAIATLERCYNNPKVFTGVVKIRKGEAVRMMMTATNLENTKAIFHHFVRNIQERVPPSDPNKEKTHTVLQEALHLTETEQLYTSSTIYTCIPSCLLCNAPLCHHLAPLEQYTLSCKKCYSLVQQFKCLGTSIDYRIASVLEIFHSLYQVSCNY